MTSAAIEKLVAGWKLKDDTDFVGIGIPLYDASWHTPSPMMDLQHTDKTAFSLYAPYTVDGAYARHASWQLDQLLQLGPFWKQWACASDCVIILSAVLGLGVLDVDQLPPDEPDASSPATAFLLRTLTKSLADSEAELLTGARDKLACVIMVASFSDHGGAWKL